MRWIAGPLAGLLAAFAAAGQSPSGGMTRVAKTVLDGQTRSLYAAAYDPAGFAYFSRSGTCHVVKVDVRGDVPQEVGSADCAGGEGGLISGAVDAAAGYAYFGALGTPGRVVKFALGAGTAAPTYLGSTPLGAGENMAFGTLVDTTDPDPAKHSLYVCTQTSPGIVVKLAPGAGDALPVRLGAAPLASGENGPRRGVLDAAHGYAYFATVTSPATFVKVALGAGASPPSRVGAVTLAADEGNIGSAVLDAAHGYAYLGTYQGTVVPAKVVKVALGAGAAPPSRVGALTLGPGERELSTGVGDPSAGFAYFGSDHTHPAKVYKVRMGDGDALPEEVGVLQLAPGTCGTACYPPDGGNITSADATLYGELYLQSSVVDTARGRAWFGTDTVPGQVVAVDLGEVRGPLRFYTLAPCRALDTRNPVGPLGGPALDAGAERLFALAGACGIPAAARAVVANVTATGAAAPGDLRLFAGDGVLTAATALSFAAGRTRANNALVGLSADGAGSIVVHADSSAPVDVIVDVSGFWQ